MPDTDTQLVVAEGKLSSGVKQDSPSFFAYGERVIIACGYLLVFASVMAFGAMGITKYISSREGVKAYESWLDLFSRETSTISFLFIGIVTALLGQRMLTTAQAAYTRTIPKDDLPLVEEAVKQGKPDPIDQYVRIRSLSGWAGNFTKLGITGLPLTTVFLTLVFSAVSLLPIAAASSFLDLAKLTLGAFIGSFVQRQVEQRRQESTHTVGTAPRPSLPA